MNGRRIGQIALLLVMAVFLVEMFTPLHAATCDSSIDKKDEKAVDLGGARGALSDTSPIAFQIHGGDNTFGDALRAAFKEAVSAKFPEQKLVDGPPPRNGILLVLTLKTDDARWTPFYSHENLGVHTTIQFPGQGKAQQISADANVDAVCKGLVSKSHFAAHGETTSSLAPWLVEQLAAAVKK
jgi:hypothetical protein